MNTQSIMAKPRLDLSIGTSLLSLKRWLKVFKHSFIYTITEEFVPIGEQTKKEIKKIKLDKYPLNYNNFSNPEEKERLKDLILSQLNTVFKKYNLKLIECWVQKYMKNHYHDLHTHRGHVEEKSFVWFIEGDKSSSPICFYDVGYPTINTKQIIEIKFKPGTLLLFPGYLPHAVPLNKSNNRLIVSGNVL